MTRKEVAYSKEELQKMLQKVEKDEKDAKKEKSQFDRGIVILVFTVNLLVLVASFYVVTKTGVEPSTTVTAWFGFAGAELWALAFLKNNKRKNQSKQKSIDEEFEEEV